MMKRLRLLLPLQAGTTHGEINRSLTVPTSDISLKTLAGDHERCVLLLTFILFILASVTYNAPL